MTRTEPPARTRFETAFSLVEILVAVTLMSIIVLGLMAMFAQTQRAFRTGMTQADIMEGGRAAMEMIPRELEQMRPTGLSDSLTFYARWNNFINIQSLPGGPTDPVQRRTNITQDILFTARDSLNPQQWNGIGYRVVFNDGIVGTLYRFETNCSVLDTLGVRRMGVTTFNMPSNRVVDGVLHFRVLAYDSNGQLIVPGRPYVVPNSVDGSIGVTNNVPGELSYEYHFRSNAVPAYLELELGLLEKKTLDRVRNVALGATTAVLVQRQNDYLTNKVGAVQVFRQRIPIRNVDPTVFQ